VYCYGKYCGKLEACPTCEALEYCRGAAEPALLTDSMPGYNDGIKSPEKSGRHAPDPAEALMEAEERAEQALYTRDDLLEVIGFMLQLDSRTVEFLSMHISNPGITFKKMGEGRKVSKQAVHKFLKNQCRKVPEIASLLRIGERKQKLKRKRTFWEEVCQIHRKMSGSASNRHANASLCWKKLICSTPSFDLSNMSIIKGVRLWKND